VVILVYFSRFGILKKTNLATLAEIRIHKMDPRGNRGTEDLKFQDRTGSSVDSANLLSLFTQMGFKAIWQSVLFGS
jgi:hypothetical protein